jgi:hypothetical protein
MGCSPVQARNLDEHGLLSHPAFVMREPVSRREALGRIATAGAIFGASAAVARLRFDRGGLGLALSGGDRQVRSFAQGAASPGPVFAIAKSSTDPAVLVRRAVAALGGMGRFVSRGDVVAIKPNIGWDRLPVHAANTNPGRRRGRSSPSTREPAGSSSPTLVTSRTAVFSVPGSGAAHELGATVISPRHIASEKLDEGDVLDQWPIYTPLVNADKVINVPIAKHHNLSKYTAAMKNWYAGGRRNGSPEHRRLDSRPGTPHPTLTVVDATRVLMRNGPRAQHRRRDRCASVIASTTR